METFDAFDVLVLCLPLLATVPVVLVSVLLPDNLHVIALVFAVGFLVLHFFVNHPDRDSFQAEEKLLSYRFGLAALCALALGLAIGLWFNRNGVVLFHKLRPPPTHNEL